MTPLDELIDVLTQFRTQQAAVTAAGQALVDCLRAGGKILTCGNGGSAAEAQHLAQELLGRYQGKDRPPLPAVCLNADSTVVTCIANDFGYDQVFARQLTALARPGDILVGFSTSGNSPSVLAAFAAARTAGITSILLGGGDGGRAHGQVTREILVPSRNPARIQEVHAVILHSWLDLVDAAFNPAAGPAS